MIFGLLGIIVFNGLEAFWPKTVHELTIAPASQGEKPLVLYAGITKDQTRHMPADPALPGSMAKDVREYQLFTGSKEAYGQSYRFVDAHNVTASSTPKGLLCLERMEGGKALVKPLDNTEIATELLTEEGCIVESANDGVACIDMIEKADADYYKMILMDIQMPVMNGYDAALVIRKMKDTKKARIPIIAMTANAFAEDTQKALSVGMNAHVAKPVDMNILVPTMMKYL